MKLVTQYINCVTREASLVGSGTKNAPDKLLDDRQYTAGDAIQVNAINMLPTSQGLVSFFNTKATNFPKADLLTQVMFNFRLAGGSVRLIKLNPSEAIVFDGNTEQVIARRFLSVAELGINNTDVIGYGDNTFGVAQPAATVLASAQALSGITLRDGTPLQPSQSVYTLPLANKLPSAGHKIADGILNIYRTSLRQFTYQQYSVQPLSAASFGFVKGQNRLGNAVYERTDKLTAAELDRHILIQPYNATTYDCYYPVDLGQLKTLTVRISAVTFTDAELQLGYGIFVNNLYPVTVAGELPAYIYRQTADKRTCFSSAALNNVWAIVFDTAQPTINLGAQVDNLNFGKIVDNGTKYPVVRNTTTEQNAKLYGILAADVDYNTITFTDDKGNYCAAKSIYVAGVGDVLLFPAQTGSRIYYLENTNGSNIANLTVPLYEITSPNYITHRMGEPTQLTPIKLEQPNQYYDYTTHLAVLLVDNVSYGRTYVIWLDSFRSATDVIDLLKQPLNSTPFYILNQGQASNVYSNGLVTNYVTIQERIKIGSIQISRSASGLTATQETYVAWFASFGGAIDAEVIIDGVMYSTTTQYSMPKLTVTATYPQETAAYYKDLELARLWSYAIIKGDLYIYQQGLGVVKVSYLDGTVTKSKFTFVNTFFIRGITTAAGRMILWDSDNSIYRSSIFDPLDFVPALATQATTHKITALKGDIQRVLGLNDHYVVYATGSIHLAKFDKRASTFTYTTLSSTSGIASAYSVAVVDNDNHVVFTNHGLFLVNTNGLTPVDFAGSDVLLRSKYPVLLEVLRDRYIIIKSADSAFSLQLGSIQQVGV